MSMKDIEAATRNLAKWLNEEQTGPIDRQALARVLAHVQLGEQPAQNQGQSCYCPECERISKELAAFKAQQQEPVAWKYKVDPAFDGQKWYDRYDLTESKSLALWKDKDAQPLYTSPQPSKPEDK